MPGCRCWLSRDKATFGSLRGSAFFTFGHQTLVAWMGFLGMEKPVGSPYEDRRVF